MKTSGDCALSLLSSGLVVEHTGLNHFLINPSLLLGSLKDLLLNGIHRHKHYYSHLLLLRIPQQRSLQPLVRKPHQDLSIDIALFFKVYIKRERGKRNGRNFRKPGQYDAPYLQPAGPFADSSRSRT